eukprot:TRINITY_DN76815_c0_g1_i1.p2 TRINITY_DN76815_c0_g1~~TRINITY_DN76815_c0_g1_i1.p2  ORF type:complete len:249 (-),score=41.87 TRINITY_DN76815_c0_g1_i1:342-1088(-)
MVEISGTCACPSSHCHTAVTVHCWHSFLGLFDFAQRSLDFMRLKTGARSGDNETREEELPSIRPLLRRPGLTPEQLRRNQVLDAVPQWYHHKRTLSRKTTVASDGCNSEASSRSDDSGSEGRACEDVGETVYRRWLVEETPDFDESEVVRGLRFAMRTAGLRNYIALVEEWCTEEGAAFLDEVAESQDEVAEYMFRDASSAPEAAEREALMQAFRKALERSKHRGPGAEGCQKEAQVLRARMYTSRLL